MLTQQQVSEVLNYNPDTGELIWIKRNRYTQRLLGKVAGCLDPNGYVKLSVSGVPTYGHIVAWLCVYGYLPTGELDHINGVRSDNRITNLREADRALNQKNTKRSIRNTTGHVGVSFASALGRYKAVTTVHGKQIFHGYFDSAEEAADARQDWIDEHPEAGFTKRHGVCV